MKKVIIGLVSKHREIDNVRTFTYISDEMKNAIFENGAIAIGIIPPCNKIILIDQNNETEIYSNINSILTEQDQENLIAQISLCDGVILSGGRESDAYEMWIAKYCYEKNIPIIGICAGHNNLVRGIGGTTKRVPRPEIHSQSNKEYVHSITIDNNSQFFQILNVEKMYVNSRHKNTIGDCKFLSIAAYDEFGNIEVTEDKSKKCFLGMRFHPESLYQKDQLHNTIFSKFIEICSK